MTNFGGFFNFSQKAERLKIVAAELEQPDAWRNLENSRALQQEKSRLESEVAPLIAFSKKLDDARELASLCLADGDESLAAEVVQERESLAKAFEKIGAKKMFPGKDDARDCFVDIQAGSGGTEAQDWAQMLRRMYLRFCERRGFAVEILEESAGEIAGIKSATLKVEGDLAYGHLRTENGVHRLVRKSPFDANHRRHTSFASVFVYPAADDSVTVEINPADLRVDTFRASGAGGQHVNTTDSAVRITHLPTSITAQCQNDRSQHKNRSAAMAMLRARLLNREIELRGEEKRRLEESKSEIAWGRQIRSYVLDQSRIKDLRSGFESGNPRAVLDGDIMPFIEASLTQKMSDSSLAEKS